MVVFQRCLTVMSLKNFNSLNETKLRTTTLKKWILVKNKINQSLYTVNRELANRETNLLRELATFSLSSVTTAQNVSVFQISTFSRMTEKYNK